jgi:hypothetical protein
MEEAIKLAGMFIDSGLKPHDYAQNTDNFFVINGRFIVRKNTQT